MSKSLSPVERSIVIKYIATEKPDLIVKSINSASDTEEFALFKPMTLKSSDYVIQNDLIVMSRASQTRVLADNAQVSVSFYYKGRALFFESSYRHSSSFFLIQISPSIFKLIESGNGIYDYIECFLSSENSSPKTETALNTNTFTTRFFPYDAFKIFADENENSIIKKFFAFDFSSEMPQIQNRILPPVLLFLGDEYLIGAALNPFVKFEVNEKYFLELTVPQAFSSRKIKGKVVCSDEYADIEFAQKKAWKFSFTELKEEDRRFLFEKLHSKMYGI